MQQKTYYGLKGLSHATPIWAKWIFRGTAIFTTVAAVWIAATSLIDENWKVELLLGCKCIDMLVLGLSKLAGVEPADKE